MRRRHLLSAAAAGAALLAAPPAFAGCRTLFPPTSEIIYRVRREGETIGDHRVAFLRDGRDFLVRTDIDIAVKILGFTAFRYRLKAEETWREGWLHALHSETDDDGEHWKLQGERRGERGEGALEFVVNGKSRTVSGYVLPSSLWHRDTPRERGLLDIVKGKLRLIEGVPRGEETVPVGGGKVAAERWSIKGELRREVWYDADCRLVRVEFPAKDGSWITVEPV